MSLLDQMKAQKSLEKPRANPSSLQIGGISTTGVGRPLNQRADADARTVTLPASSDGVDTITITT